MYSIFTKIINLYLVVALFPINRVIVDDLKIFKMEYVEIVIVLLSIISVFRMLIIKNIKGLLDFWNILLYSMILFVVGLVNSINKLQSSKKLLILICLSIYIVNLTIMIRKKKINILSNINLGFFLFLIINYIYIYIKPNETAYNDFRYGLTYQGITGHRIHLALSCGLIIIVSYLNIKNKSRIYNKIISIFNILSSIFFIFNTKSSTCIISLVIILVLVIINKSKMYISGSAVIILSNIISIILISIIPILERIQYIWNINITFTGRTNIWKGIIEMILARKSGYGYATFWGNNQYSAQYYSKYYIGGHAHNGILEMLIQFGFIGTVILIIWLCRNIKILKEKKLYKYIEVKFSYMCLVFIFITSITEPILFSYQYINIFNYIFFISLAFLNTSNKGIEK